jgi:hypothetical protein
LTSQWVQDNGAAMARSQRKTTIAVLRGILPPYYGREDNFAKLAKHSRDWVKKVSAGKSKTGKKGIRLTEGTARLLELETGISLSWLLGPPTAKPVNGRGDRYTRRDFEWHRAEMKAGRPPITNASYPLNYAPQIAAIGSAAGDKGKASIFSWRLETFLEQCAEEFGFDKEAHTNVWSILKKASKKMPLLDGILFHDAGLHPRVVRRIHREIRTIASQRSSRVPR